MAKTSKDWSHWAEVQEKGLLNYVFVRWVVKWGLPAAGLDAFIHWQFPDIFSRPYDFKLGFAKWIVLAILVGAMEWKFGGDAFKRWKSRRS
jgi:hypothetical protein